MIRMVGLAFLLAIATSVLFAHGSQTVFWVVFLAVLAGLAVPLLQGRSALRCPACRKRVKLGATACHHCGRQVST